MKGLLVTFEGQDGSGKSTFLRLIESCLRQEGLSALVVSEFSDRVVGKFLQETLTQNKFLRLNDSGVSALVDMGYHFIDLLIWYFGMPTSVTARMTRGNRSGQKYDVEDTVHLLFDYHLELHYDEKLAGNFVISRVYPEKQERVRVFGTSGVVEVSRGLVRRLDINGNEIERLERQGGWPSAAVEQLDHFAERIRQFVPGTLPDYTEHLQHVAVIEAAYESDRSGTSCRPSDMLKLI